jgi:hypothetical protein
MALFAFDLPVKYTKTAWDFPLAGELLRPFI